MNLEVKPNGLLKYQNNLILSFIQCTFTQINFFIKQYFYSMDTKHYNFILNKPYNCLSQFIYEGKRKKSKNLLGELYNFPKGTMAIGRLDEDSEGSVVFNN